MYFDINQSILEVSLTFRQVYIFNRQFNALTTLLYYQIPNQIVIICHLAMA